MASKTREYIHPNSISGQHGLNGLRKFINKSNLRKYYGSRSGRVRAAEGLLAGGVGLGLAAEGGSNYLRNKFDKSEE